MIYTFNFWPLKFLSRSPYFYFRQNSGISAAFFAAENLQICQLPVEEFVKVLCRHTFVLVSTSAPDSCPATLLPRFRCSRHPASQVIRRGHVRRWLFFLGWIVPVLLLTFNMKNFRIRKFSDEVTFAGSSNMAVIEHETFRRSVSNVYVFMYVH